MNQARRQVLAAAVLSRDKHRRADLGQQFGLGPQFAHGGAGRDEEHVVADLFNFVGHDFALAALGVMKERTSDRGFELLRLQAAGPDNPARPGESLPASDSGSSELASTNTGRSGRTRRSQRRVCRPSESPCIRSSTIRSGPGPAWTRSRASQPLPAVSNCQPWSSPRIQGRSRADRSLLTSKICAGFHGIFDQEGNSLQQLRSDCSGESISQRFDFVSFDPYRQRSLDGIDRNNQRAIAVAGKQYAFHTFERTAANAHSLSDFQEGMLRPGNLLRDHGAQGFDLFVRNRDRFSAHADDAKHSVGAIHAHALVIVAGNSA